MLAILADAMGCYRRFVLAPAGRERRLFRDAEQWLLGTSEATISLQDVCDGLGLDPPRIRARLQQWRRHVLESVPAEHAALVRRLDDSGPTERPVLDARGSLPTGELAAAGARPTHEEKIWLMRSRVLERARVLGNVSAACREAGISRTFFYRWRRRLARGGDRAPGGSGGADASLHVAPQGHSDVA
jgi:hypothetical protein